MLKEKAAKGIDYPAYVELIENLLGQGKTTGSNHSDAYLDYTRMNQTRMNRIEKTIDLDDRLKELIAQIQQPMTFLVLAEAWCGDVAQNLPIIYKMVAAHPLWEMRIVMRDEHPDLMQQYLTNGGMAIPKVIVFETASGNYFADWGPRPAEAQQMVLDYKQQENRQPYGEFVKKVQLWYAKDKGKALQSEWETILMPLKALFV